MWKGKGIFIACHLPARPSLVRWESRQGCICRVWFPTSLMVSGVSLPWSQGRGHGPWSPVTRTEVGICILLLCIASAAGQTRAVLPWHDLFQGKLPFGSKRVLLIQLGPEKVRGSWVFAEDKAVRRNTFCSAGWKG